MFTQAMPAYIDALRQTVPASQVMPMAQALGNCQQPLTHRGGVNFAGNPQRQNPRQPGVYTSPSWNQQSVSNLFPYAGQVVESGDSAVNIDLPGMEANWNNGNRYDSQFYFPTNQWFTQNQFYGGPQFNVHGGARADTLDCDIASANTVNVTNLSAARFNGSPVALPPDSAGAPGRDGRPGAAGAPGRNGAIPPGFFGPIRYLTGLNPRVDYQPVRVAKPVRYVADVWVMEAVTISVPQNLYFNPETCEITYDSVEVVVGSTVAPVPASSATDAKGFAIKDLDVDFWANTPSVVVAADPELAGVSPEAKRVFQQ